MRLSGSARAPAASSEGVFSISPPGLSPEFSLGVSEGSWGCFWAWDKRTEFAVGVLASTASNPLSLSASSNRSLEESAGDHV